MHQSDAQLALMDEWNVRTHTGSGPVDRVKASTVGDREAELATIGFSSSGCRRENRQFAATASVRTAASCSNICRNLKLTSLSLSRRQHPEELAPLEAGNPRWL